MWRLLSYFKALSVFASLFGLIILFQNCSVPSANSAFPSQNKMGGVDGMKYIRAGLCPDGTSAVDAVTVAADLSAAQYVRQNCKDLTVPLAVPVNNLQFAVNEQSVFVLNEGIYATVKDGSANAKAGQAEFPKMLANYLIRPSWKVAGVDYPVGVTTSSLKDPLTINIPGVTVDPTAHEVVVNADNITLDGYDFSLDGGWSVVVGEHGAAHNTTILNSNFMVGANKVPMLWGDSASTNLYVGYCTFDSNNTEDDLGSTAIAFTGNGLTVEYSWFKNSPLDFIDAGAGTIVVRYNLFNNNGSAAGTAADWIQLAQGDHYLVNDYNTYYQTETTGSGTEGINVSGQVGTWTINSAEILSNTIVTLAGTKVSDDVVIGTAHIVGSAIVRDNFVDPTGSADFAASGSSCALGSCPASPSASSIFADNINMLTGVSFPDNP